MAAPKPDFDSPWKEALEHYFPAFIQLLVPALHDQIDWSHAVVFLDKELQAVSYAAASGRRYADKLVRVRSKNTSYFWIVVHVEIQGGRVTPVSLTQFSERMYQYNFRIHDHYGQVIGPSRQHPNQVVALISLGVLTAGRGTATELVYQRNALGLCSTNFRFPIVYLANWLDRWDELQNIATTNPFAVLIMAQLQAQQAGKNKHQKLVSKTQIMRRLYSYRYSAQDRRQLFRLVDWMLTTPPELEADFKQAMVTIEQEHKMSYITTFERMGQREGLKEGLQKGLEQGLKKGLQKGKLEGEASLLQRQLVRKFGPLPAALQTRLKTATLAQLETWSLNFVDTDNLDDIFTD